MDTKTVDIDTLEVGPELDLLIAQEFMVAFRTARSVSPMFYQMGAPCITIEHEPGRISTVSIPPYSTNIRAAFEVLARFDSYDLGHREYSKQVRYKCEVIKLKPYQLGISFCETLPLAICRAALKAVTS
jgi:hypothetical protein